MKFIFRKNLLEKADTQKSILNHSHGQMKLMVEKLVLYVDLAIL